MPFKSRALALLLALPLLARAWTTSVEFPWNALPRPVWERELAHLKEMGVTHVSLPAAKESDNPAALNEVIHIVRALALEADLEGPIPDRLLPLAKSHGGPLTDPPAAAVSISAIMPRALDNERQLLISGTQAIRWTDVFETLNPAWKPGAITLAGAEGPGAALIRREAQLTRFWGAQFATLTESPGARLSAPADNVSVHQFASEKTGTSVAAVHNESPTQWTGEVRVMYSVLMRVIGLPAVAVQPYEALWLPVDIPLAAGPLCSGCSAFAPSDHLIYATAELTDMEYENGILAMEFVAPAAGEAVLQLSHEPPGPLIAAGRPTVFDWDAKTQRARLPIPAGNAKTGRVRVALAIDAPPATAFFDNASVLLIGETNRVTAEFSPPAVAARSRLRTSPDLTVTPEDPPPPPSSTDDPDKKDQPVVLAYKIAVPASAIPGDTAQLSLEADGVQLSHAQPRILAPVALTFSDAVSVRVAPNSLVPLSPPTIPVNQKPGREVVFSLHNNAPEIRTFDVTIHVPGLDFSPDKLTVSVGASVTRDITFRVFSSSASPGVHEGEVRLTGAATLTEPVHFVVLPPTSTTAWSAEGFSILEDPKKRASFLGDRWLEMLDKESGADSQPAGGTVFTGGPVDSLKLEDLAH